MMKKLIRYHLIWDAKLPAYYAAFALVSVLINRLTALRSEVVIWNVISKIFFGVAISMAVSTVINTLIRCWIRFTRTSYKDESYLYHTLPVPRATLYRSHVISSLLCVAASVVFAALCLVLLMVGTDAWTAIRSVFAGAFDARNLILMIALIFIELIFLSVCGTVGTIFGYSFDGARTLKSVLFAVLFYQGAGLVALPLVFLLGLTDPEIRALFGVNSTVLPASLWKITLPLAIFYLAVCAILLWVGKKRYLKKINVD